MNNASPNTALIVGAGIGGLAAAISLRNAGWRVRVFERAADPRELGFALLLAPNAMHALRQLGVADAVLAGGVVARAGEMRRPDGTVLKHFDAEAMSAPLGESTVCVLRQVLHGILLDKVGSDAIHLNSQVMNISESAASVTIHMADGQTASGDVLIGADGVGSTIRKLLHPDEPAPFPSGLFAVRGVALDVAPHLNGLNGAQYFGRGIEAGLGRASERAVYWFMSVRADEAAPYLGGVAKLVDHFVARFHEPFRAIVAATRPEDLRLDELLERHPLTTWGRGNTTLLGDAAHPMLPHAGQGAAQAIEDAVTLGRALAVEGSISDSLRRYERIRAKRTGSVVRLAKRNSRMGALRSAIGCWARDLLIRLTPTSVIAKAMISLARPPEE